MEAETVDINGGTIDGTTIATSDITVGTDKTLNVSAGTLTLAAGQIEASKITGSTFGVSDDYSFAGSTIANLGTVTTADINGGTIDGVRLGVDSAVTATGSFTGSFKGDGSSLTGIVTSLNLSDGTDTDSVDLKTDTLTIAGDSATNIVTNVTDNKIQISASLASTSQVGVASFSSDNFATTDGVVTIKNGGVANAELANSKIVLNTSGQTDDVALGENLTITGSLNEISTSLGSSNELVIGLPDDVTIGDELTVTNGATFGGGYSSTGVTIHTDGHISASGNVLVKGNLEVLGETTRTNTVIASQDLTIEDNLILIGSGSNSNTGDAVDSGIVFERTNNAPNKHSVFFFDESVNRFAVGVTDTVAGLVDDGLTGETEVIENPALVVTAVTSSGRPSDTYVEENGVPNKFGHTATTAVGQISIDTDTGEIYIYS